MKAGLMVLITTVERAKRMMERKRIFLDSCILNDMATNPEVAQVIEKANKIHTLIFSTPSLLEVGFGVPKNVPQEQHDLASRIYTDERIMHVTGESFVVFTIQSELDPPEAIVSLCPSHHEWYAARRLLLATMGVHCDAKNGVKLRMDALIYMSAWNSQSFLITNNTKDFKRLYEVNAQGAHRQPVPFFTLDELRRSFDEDVCFH